MKFGADQKPRESGGESFAFTIAEAIACLYNEQTEGLRALYVYVLE